MKNITLSADGDLIEAARERAREDKTTLNEQFRSWLALYARTSDRARNYDAAIKNLRGKVTVGTALSREDMNER